MGGFADLVRDVPDFPKPGVTFKDITAVSSADDQTRSRPAIELAGFDADHIVEDVMFQNVKLDGKVIGASDVRVNDFVRNVRYEQ